MQYSLLFDPPVIVYLQSLSDLSRQGRVMLYSDLHFGLRLNGDSFRNEPSSRLPGNFARFTYEILIRDNGQFHHFWFVVNDSSAAYGVLRIEYVERS